MKFGVIIAVVVCLASCTYWWLARAPEQHAPTKIEPVEEIPAEVLAVSSGQTYNNTEWGIAFAYSNDWQVNENTFRAGSSLFNILLQPKKNDHLPDPIVINFAPKNWGQTLYERAPSNEDFREVTVGSYEGVSYSSTDMGLPTTVYLIPTEAEFWVTIIAKQGYEEVLDQVLGSFEISPAAS